MKASLVALGLAAITSVVAVPVESEALSYAKRLYARHANGPFGQQLMKRSSAPSELDVLNFALNLEYLEAQFYHLAAYGSELPQSLLNGTGTKGHVEGAPGHAVPFKNKVIRQYANEIAQDELHHVQFLRSALGSKAVAMPELNLGSAFTAAAQAAGIISKGQTFSPYADDTSFLLGAFIFEDVGVTAYNGGATLISTPAYLQAAASILAVEAYHASEVRTTLFALGQQMQAAINDANAISKLRGSVGGGKDQGIQVNGVANIVPADSNSLAFARTPSEVLAIVYLGSASKPGGFFPKGLNGNIH